MQQFNYNNCSNEQAIEFYDELQGELGEYTNSIQITKFGEVFVGYSLLQELTVPLEDTLIEFDDYLVKIDFNTNTAESFVYCKDGFTLHYYDTNISLQDVKDTLQSFDCKSGDRLARYLVQEYEFK